MIEAPLYQGRCGQCHDRSSLSHPPSHTTHNVVPSERERGRGERGVGGRFHMGEVLLHCRQCSRHDYPVFSPFPRKMWEMRCTCRVQAETLQGYLAHKKPHPLRTPQ